MKPLGILGADSPGPLTQTEEFILRPGVASATTN